MIDGIPNWPLYFYQKDIIGFNLEGFQGLNFSRAAENGPGPDIDEPVVDFGVRPLHSSGMVINPSMVNIH